MVFVSHEVPFPATSDRRSRVAGNGTEREVKTIQLSLPTSGGEQLAFLNFHNFTAVKKIVPKLGKLHLIRLWIPPSNLVNCPRLDIQFIDNPVKMKMENISSLSWFAGLLPSQRDDRSAAGIQPGRVDLARVGC